MTKTVTISALRADSTPYAHHDVIVTLVAGSAGGVVGSNVIVSSSKVRLDANGAGSVVLETNEAITSPSTSFYRLTVEGSSPTITRSIRLTNALASSVSWALADIQVGDPTTPDRDVSSDYIDVDGVSLTNYLTNVALLDAANEFTAMQSIDVTVPVTPVANTGTTKPTILFHLHGGGGAIVNHFAFTVDLGGGTIVKRAGTLVAVVDLTGAATDEWLLTMIGQTGPGVRTVTSTDPGELPWISDLLSAVPATWVVATPTDDTHAATKAYVDAGGGGGVALGETSTTAYRGDRGKTAYDYSQAHTGATDPHGDRAYAAALVDDLSGVTNASTARTNLGLGSLATASTIASADITDGTIVAGDLAASVSSRIPTTVRVASDVNSTTDASFTNTTGLSFPVVNGTTYYIVGVLDVTGINAADLKVTATCPAGTIRVSVQGKNNASSLAAADGAYSGEITSSGEEVSNLAVITGRSTCVSFQGYFACTADGTFQMQHAQRNANATPTVAKAGSYLTYHT